MALINCHECNKEISDQAPACPHCGAPKKKQEIKEVQEVIVTVNTVKEETPKKMGCLKIFLIILVVGSILGVILQAVSEKDGKTGDKKADPVKTEKPSDKDVSHDEAYAKAEKFIPICKKHIENKASYIAKHPYSVDTSKPFFDKFSIGSFSVDSPKSDAYKHQLNMEGRSVIFSDGQGEKENIKYSCSIDMSLDEDGWFTLIYGEGGNDNFFDTKASMRLFNVYSNLMSAITFKKVVKNTTGGGYENAVRSIVKDWVYLDKECGRGSRGACGYRDELARFLNEYGFCNTGNGWGKCQAEKDVSLTDTLGGKQEMAIINESGVKPTQTSGSSDSSQQITYPTSFDCSKSRSIPEYLICHDPELAEADRNLAVTFQEAKNAVTDKDAFAARARKQWNFREKHCRDKACLQSWYTYQDKTMKKIAQTGDVDAQAE